MMVTMGIKFSSSSPSWRTSSSDSSGEGIRGSVGARAANSARVRRASAVDAGAAFVA